MKFTSSVVAALVLLDAAIPVHSFMYTRQANNLKCTIGRRVTTESSSSSSSSSLFLSPEDLTDYMAKAHEEKIRAVKEVEDKKNAQINVSQGKEEEEEEEERI
ncbi:MAG: hypothetical protein ACI8RD_003436 [Bacillariaceae sp.]|jgi:hypothetical protein